MDYGVGGGFQPQQRYVPVDEGEELDVTIEAVGAKGDGIAKKEGFVIFVPDTKEGDRCRIRITRVLSKVAFGEKIGAAQSEDEDSSEEAPEDVAEEKAPEEMPGEEDFGEEDFGDETPEPPEEEKEYVEDDEEKQ